MFESFLASQAGMGEGQLARQKDDQTRADAAAKEQQRQAELAAANAESQREFDAQNTLAVNRDKRDQAVTDRDAAAWKPADKKTGFPGGYKWQEEQQTIAKGNAENKLLPLTIEQARLRNRGMGIGNEGAALGNKAQEIANSWAPVLNSLKTRMDQVTIENNVGRTRANEQSDALALAAYKNTVKASNPADRVKAYTKSLHDVTMAGNALKGGTKGPNGQTVMYFSPEQMTMIEQKASEIDSSPDPVSKAMELTKAAADAKVPNATLIADYLMQRAQTAYLRQQAFPATGQGAQPAQQSLPAGLQLPPLPWMKNGGSNAAARPTISP